MKRLAISNIAWKPAEQEAVHAILQELGVHGMEIAPGLAFAGEPDPFAPSQAAAFSFLQALQRRGLELVSMQSLLFGVQDALLFGTDGQRGRFKDGLMRATSLARRLGVKNLVMGSPANRVIPDGMSRGNAWRIAAGLFREIGDCCFQFGAKLALEPNPATYGTNFLTCIDETVEFAQMVGHPAVAVNFDIGSLHMNGEIGAADQCFAKAEPFVSHVHISEPQLAPAPKDAKQFEALARSILKRGYVGWLSIEMRAAGDENLAGVRASVAASLAALKAAVVEEALS